MKTKQSGIYAIKNTTNKKFYVGSSINIEKRHTIHLSDLRCQRHYNEHLQRAWNKYGENAFEFELIVPCNEDDLLWIEQVYLDWYWNDDVLYNMNPIADKPPVTEESRRKLSEAHRGRGGESHPMWSRVHTKESREKMSRAHTGMTHTEETKRKISQSHLGNKNHFWGKTHNKEARKKISDAGLGRQHSEDAKRKIGLASRGENNPSTKLTNQDVWEIRRLYATGKVYQWALAKMWKISQTHISCIVRQESWTHI